MKNLIKSNVLILILTVFVACSSDDDDGPILNASVNNTLIGLGDFSGDVIGNGGTTREVFTWNNASTTADYSMGITSSSTGTFNFLIQDSEGVTVLDKTLEGDTDLDSYSGVTIDEGVAGDWTLTVTLTTFNGGGSFSGASVN